MKTKQNRATPKKQTTTNKTHTKPPPKKTVAAVFCFGSSLRILYVKHFSFKITVFLTFKKTAQFSKQSVNSCFVLLVSAFFLQELLYFRFLSQRRLLKPRLRPAVRVCFTDCHQLHPSARKKAVDSRGATVKELLAKCKALATHTAEGACMTSSLV